MKQNNESLEERIQKLMSKDVVSKTILVCDEDLPRIIEEHAELGFKLVNQVKLNNKVKVTFQKYK